MGLYRQATAQQERAAQMVHDLALTRGWCVAALRVDGFSYRQIGVLLGISATRAQQLARAVYTEEEVP